MPGAIALVGGDEFRPGCEEMDRELMRASGHDPARVVIIPTAAAFESPDRAAANGVRHFSALGGSTTPLMVTSREQADDPGMATASEDADLIYFTGGSPDHLLATLRGSRLLEALREALDRGAVLAGSSAGAMVMGSLMRRPSGGQWVDGLGIVPGVAVLPHHERRDPSETSRQLSSQVPSGLVVLGIDGRAGCLGRPGGWRVVGRGNVTVYRDGEWAVYRPGDMLPADTGAS